jgi:hypothetical protein
MQNTSHAVMAQRQKTAPDDPNDFPTPLWATRALMEHVIGTSHHDQSVLEPACGRGTMVKPLREYFGAVFASDIHDYGFGFPVADFLDPKIGEAGLLADWTISNPPFRAAEEFIVRGLGVSSQGVAMLVRTQFLEGVGRYGRLFCYRPPTVVAFFTERVPMVKGRLDPKISTATSYSWLVWQHGVKPKPPIWIPPCRKSLDLASDYEGPWLTP